VQDAFVKRILVNLAIAIKSFTNPLTKCYISDLSPSHPKNYSIFGIKVLFHDEFVDSGAEKLLCVSTPHFNGSKHCPAPQYSRIPRLSQPLQPFSVAYSLSFPARKMSRFSHRRGNPPFTAALSLVLLSAYRNYALKA
jgi:hypothetical protein